MNQKEIEKAPVLCFFTKKDKMRRQPRNTNTSQPASKSNKEKEKKKTDASLYENIPVLFSGLNFSSYMPTVSSPLRHHNPTSSTAVLGRLLP
jgi:hypothetical protein